MNNKLLAALFMVFVLTNISHAQSLSFDTLLNRSKSEFKKDSGNNYALAITNLNKALLLKPKNAEAHYFLAYAYSRINSSDGSSIDNMKLGWVLKASYQLESLIKLSPVYTGEIISLDAYSKLTSEWGAMALSYIINDKPDSAIWALKEGKKRGGYDDFILSECRLVLKACNPNSVLISSGDNFFFPILYLQKIENLRKDVSVIDVSMINAVWYPEYLIHKERISFDIKTTELDTISYKKWADSTISIPINGTNNSFKWLLMPSYEKGYILRGDRILLSFLRENKFRRDVYFTKGFTVEDELSLPEYLLELPTVDKLNVTHTTELTNEKYAEQLKNMLAEINPSNKNSPDEQYPIEYIRSNVADRITLNIKLGNNKQAAYLIKLLDTYLPEKDFPYTTDELKGNLNVLRKQLQ